MSNPKPQTWSSPEIELPVLTSHARSIQPPSERVPFSTPISDANSENRTVNSIAMVDDVLVPPTPAYFLPSNDILPIQSSDASLLEYTRLHGHSEIPLSSMQREYDRTSVHASLAELPAYRAEPSNPPRYSQSRHDSGDPPTWPAISFRIGFLFPLFWFFGALTLITPQGSLDRIFMPWFKDFAPSADSWLNTLQVEAEKEEYLARMRVAERRWAKRCLYAFSLLLFLIAAAVGIAIGVSRIQ